ncbi:MAG: DUF2461 domain-containing protein [Clostridiales bacterium]|nr:DUF2461 domain-containing protein [Clostridiales bacterium]
MFKGFTQETIDFFLQLGFNNYKSFFEENRQQYYEKVRNPFYAFIESLAPTMLQIDPQIEVRPHKCLARIHRDTRFSKDKSPYRDHLWVLFKQQNEARRDSLMFWFELSPRMIAWGMGFWGRSSKQMEAMRKKLREKPDAFLRGILDSQLQKHQMGLSGEEYKRIIVPDNLPLGLHEWYRKKEVYIQKIQPNYAKAITEELVPTIASDFLSLQPLYQMLREVVEERKTI